MWTWGLGVPGRGKSESKALKQGCVRRQRGWGTQAVGGVVMRSEGWTGSLRLAKSVDLLSVSREGRGKLTAEG